MKINHKQQRLIKCLQRAMSMDEDTYRAMLGGFSVTTSSDLTSEQADTLINRLMSDAVKSGRWVKSYFRAGRVNTVKKYDELGKRPGMATPAQLRLIEVQWRDVTRYTNPIKIEEALQHFIEKRFHRADLISVEAYVVPKILNAIYAMRKQKLAGDRPAEPDPTKYLENR